MKIAYVLPYLQKPTGWRNHSTAFIKAIQEHVEPVLFVAAADYEISQSLFSGLRIYPLPVTQLASLATRRGLRNLAASYWKIAKSTYPAVDLVHSLEAYPTGLVGAWLAQKKHCPHAITTHGTYGVVWAERRLDRLAYEQTLRKTRLICPVSHGTARMVHQYFARALANTCVRPILNGNPYHKTISRETAFNRSFPVIPTLITVGDIKPRKGHHLSLAAFARVKAQIPQARYRIVGNFKISDPYFQQLQQYIASQQLNDVAFLGVVSDADLRRYYLEASLFVLTPQQEGLHFEGFGLVYLEAGAYGLPVVATRTGGVPDAVKDGQTGFLANPGEVEEIANAITRLLSEPELCRRMGRANRQWAEMLTWERCAREQYLVYQDLFTASCHADHSSP